MSEPTEADPASAAAEVTASSREPAGDAPADPLPITLEQTLLQTYPGWRERVFLLLTTGGSLWAGWWIWTAADWPPAATWATVACGLPVLWWIGTDVLMRIWQRAWQRRRAPGTRVS